MSLLRVELSSIFQLLVRLLLLVDLSPPSWFRVVWGCCFGAEIMDCHYLRLSCFLTALYSQFYASSSSSIADRSVSRFGGGFLSYWKQWIFILRKYSNVKWELFSFRSVFRNRKFTVILGVTGFDLYNFPEIWSFNL